MVADLHSDAVAVAMGGHSILPKADFYAAIMRTGRPKLATEAQTCANGVKALSNFRNDIAHGRWLTSLVKTDLGGKKRRVLAMKKFKDNRSITVEEIEQKYGDLCRLSRHLADIQWRISASSKPGEWELPSPWHGSF